MKIQKELLSFEDTKVAANTKIYEYIKLNKKY
jgi:hypothetical protein